MMEYRNPKISTPDGWIDCEINHPQYGWIPFTANPADTGAAFDVAELHAEMSADPGLAPYEAPPPPIEPPPPSKEDLMAKLIELQNQIAALG